jgi:hypothetical protein
VCIYFLKILFINLFRIYIRGYNTDEMALCTVTETFCCKELEVSNSLIVLENRTLNEMEFFPHDSQNFKKLVRKFFKYFLFFSKF